MTYIENLAGVLEDFDRDVRAAEQQVTRDHRDAVARGAALLVGFTPVRKGHMAASWEIHGAGLPSPSHDRERTDPSKIATIQRLNRDAAFVEPGLTSIENFAEYAGHVDDGTSKQAPQAIVVRAEIALAAELAGRSE